MTEAMHFTQAELEILRGLLEEERSAIHELIHHSHRPDTKEELREKLRRVEGMLERMKLPAPA